MLVVGDPAIGEEPACPDKQSEKLSRDARNIRYNSEDPESIRAAIEDLTALANVANRPEDASVFKQICDSIGYALLNDAVNLCRTVFRTDL